MCRRLPAFLSTLPIEGQNPAARVLGQPTSGWDEGAPPKTCVNSDRSANARLATPEGRQVSDTWPAMEVVARFIVGHRSPQTTGTGI